MMRKMGRSLSRDRFGKTKERSGSKESLDSSISNLSRRSNQSNQSKTLPSKPPRNEFIYSKLHIDIQLYINSVKGQNQKCQIHRVILVILDRKEMEEYLVCQGQVHFQQLIHNLNDMHLHVFRFVIVRFRELKTFSQKKKEVILNRLEVEDQLNQPNQLNHRNRLNQSNQIEEDRLNQDHQIKTNYKISLQNLFFRDRNI